MGKIQRITDFGAFVEIMPGTDGLLHVSEIANHRVKDVRDELKEGEQMLVKVINIDPTGKIRLSRKALLQPEEGRRGRRRARPLAAANRLARASHVRTGQRPASDSAWRPDDAVVRLRSGTIAMRRMTLPAAAAVLAALAGALPATGMTACARQRCRRPMQEPQFVRFARCLASR